MMEVTQFNIMEEIDSGNDQKFFILTSSYAHLVKSHSEHFFGHLTSDIQCLMLYPQQ
jgi:hypothetical protein